MADDAHAADTTDVTADMSGTDDGKDTETATDASTEDNGDDDGGDDLAKQLAALQSDKDKLEKEVERLVQIARKADQRAKSNDDKAKTNAQAAAELERIKRESMSELERAVADARAQAKAEAMAEFGATLVEAEFRAAAAGRMDADALEVIVGGLNLTKFVEDGKVNRDEVARYVDSIAPAKTNEEQQPPKPKRQAQDSQNGNANADIGQGAGRGKAHEDLALNGDGIFEALQRAVGNSRR